MQLTLRNQLAIGLVLLAMLVLTRSQHFASLHALPGASWAVFFLAGLYIRSVWGLPFFLVAAWGLDFAAFRWGGASDFCLTSAYVALLPAYGALWFAGQWYEKRHEDTWRTLPLLAASVFVGAFVCELISSGSFYFFSGRFEAPTVAEFLPRIATYFPAYLSSIAFWVASAAIVHMSILAMSRRGDGGQISAS